MKQARDPLGELRRFFHERRIRPEDGVLLAVSGGRDSMTLAKAFALWQAREPKRVFRVRAACVDHGLREAATKEARFVRQTLARWGLRTDIVKLDPPKRFPDGALAWARQARYAALEALCQKHRLTSLVTAHHQDDLAETVLLRLLRSSAVQPLSSMQRGTLGRLRPFLALRRADIDRFAKKHGVPYFDDPTNTDPSHPRTRVRQELIPLLDGLCGNTIVARLGALARDLAEDEDELARRAEAIAGALGEHPNIAVLSAIHPALRRRALFAWLKRTAGMIPNRAQLDGALALLTSTKGEVSLGPTHVLVRAGTELRLRRGSKEVSQPSAPGRMHDLQPPKREHRAMSALDLLRKERGER